jgi:hypothetical protein
VQKRPSGKNSVFIQTLPSSDYPTPDTTTSGKFELREGCLNFVTREGNFRAVLPSGSKFISPSTILFGNGGQIPIGEFAVVKGAESEFGSASARPPACPTKAILIGGVVK